MCVGYLGLWLESRESKGNSDKESKTRGAQDREDQWKARGAGQEAAGRRGAQRSLCSIFRQVTSSLGRGMTKKARRRREQRGQVQGHEGWWTEVGVGSQVREVQRCCCWSNARQYGPGELGGTVELQYGGRCNGGGLLQGEDGRIEMRTGWTHQTARVGRRVGTGSPGLKMAGEIGAGT